MKPAAVTRLARDPGHLVTLAVSRASARGHPAAMKRALAALALLWAGWAAADGSRVVVILQESPLAGFQYHAGREVWNELKVGDPLTLTREPDNPHDPRAVRVDWKGLKLGYVPRRDNEAVARLMDRGQAVAARIVRLAEARDPWARVRFEIVLPLNPEVPR